MFGWHIEKLLEPDNHSPTFDLINLELRSMAGYFSVFSNKPSLEHLQHTTYL